MAKVFRPTVISDFKRKLEDSSDEETQKSPGKGNPAVKAFCINLTIVTILSPLTELQKPGQIKGKPYTVEEAKLIVDLRENQKLSWQLTPQEYTPLQ